MKLEMHIWILRQFYDKRKGFGMEKKYQPHGWYFLLNCGTTTEGAHPLVIRRQPQTAPAPRPQAGRFPWTAPVLNCIFRTCCLLLSRMKAGLPSYTEDMKPVILHSDMNNFYASVEILYDPTLRDKPVAVAGDEEARHGIVRLSLFPEEQKPSAGPTSTGRWTKSGASTGIAASAGPLRW